MVPPTHFHQYRGPSGGGRAREEPICDGKDVQWGKTTGELPEEEDGERAPDCRYQDAGCRVISVDQRAKADQDDFSDAMTLFAPRFLAYVGR